MLDPPRPLEPPRLYTSDEVDAVVAQRGRIERAKGILMCSFGISENEAFGKLRLLSRQSNLKLPAIVNAVLEDPLAAHRRWE